MSGYDYIRDPAAIYRRSQEMVAQETDISTIPAALRQVVYRLVHACGMPDIVEDLRWFGSAATMGTRALASGAPIIVDCEMVADGIIRSRLPAGNAVICTLNDRRTRAFQSSESTTRSAAAVNLWREHLDQAVVAIGNAPTALFRLLELLAEESVPRPAALFAFPVGFVGAAESKSALVEANLDIPFITLSGRRGGSAIAAAAVNALSGSLSQ